MTSSQLIKGFSWTFGVIIFVFYRAVLSCLCLSGPLNFGMKETEVCLRGSPSLSYEELPGLPKASAH